ncbi:Xyloglucan endotransglucosylase/hydrolase protein 9 [Vitis vinifera]|uniref:Xyloglucan endotransglucosylase/hydrolase n=1 Tax=Vitis vinifera TaxID=29760 RepID=A0A438CUC2_VITVI|nr:Xyloglucan endotransglucosylase/hydrolase protein 9 [Vitis vinifera]
MAVPSVLPLLFGFLAFSVVVFVGSASSSKFTELFQPGAGFSSKSKYMFGKVSIQIKLVEGDSAGTVTAFYLTCTPLYSVLSGSPFSNFCSSSMNLLISHSSRPFEFMNMMSSDGPNHNEFDFEFLGNTTGEPYLVQTNIYVNGVGNREQRLNLWFDPTKDFHSYTFMWNQRQVVFLVDETPVRVHTNMEKHGLPFPKDQPMGVYSSIWNADDWATQGGRVKTDWSHAPFIASYKGFEIDACECPIAVAADDNAKRCSSSGEKRYWWDEPTLAELNLHQSHQLLWVRANHMVYDYCTIQLGSCDSSRMPAPPPLVKSLQFMNMEMGFGYTVKS